MARRKKACEYCDDDQIVQEEGKNGHQLSTEFYPDHCLFAVTSFAQDENGETMELQSSFRFEYCPFCGRKLGW